MQTQKIVTHTISNANGISEYIVDITKSDTNKTIKLNTTKKEHNFFIFIITNNSLKDYNIEINNKNNSNTNVIINCINLKNGNIKLHILNEIGKSSNVKTKQIVNGINIYDNSTIEVVPAINTSNNKIDANHEVNIGHLNKEKLFYLMTKGFSKNHADNMLIDFMFHLLKKSDCKELQESYNNIIKTLSLK